MSSQLQLVTLSSLESQSSVSSQEKCLNESYPIRSHGIESSF